jgi:hypothetical protein
VEADMPKSKIIISLLITILLLAMQIGVVSAAPVFQEETPFNGNIENIVLEEDPESGVFTVLVTITSGNNDPQAIRLSLETAAELGLVTDDGSGNMVINDVVIGTIVQIDPTEVLLDNQEKEHPVGSAISEFFSDIIGVDYETVIDYHNNGIGFGVIAQALWLTNALEGDTEMFGDIIEAKRSGDYSAIILPDGSTPQNWGQFRQGIMSDRDKAKENLGAIMSGRAEKDSSVLKFNTHSVNGTDHQNENNKNKDKNKDKSKGNKD